MPRRSIVRPNHDDLDQSDDEDGLSWRCQVCTFINRGMADLCEICEVDKTIFVEETKKQRPTTMRTLVNSQLSFERQSSIHEKFSMASIVRSPLASMAVRQRRHDDEAEAEKSYQRIRQECRKKNTHFIDRHFSPSPESLGPYFSHEVYQWLRIGNITSSLDDRNSSKWTIVSPNPSPADVQQGLLGNCWLIAALSLIVERPKLLQRIILTREINKEGIYLVRLCHNGLWKTITVDDSFPCSQYGTLLFSKTRGKQLYIPLIEKACAKLFGSYSNLISGQLYEGLQLFTGAPCDNIDLEKEDETVDEDILWAKLVSCCSANLLIGTATGRRNLTRDLYERVKLNGNHAYSILAVHAMGRHDHRFVLVRDPHSHSNYRDEHVTNEVLQVLKTIHPARRETGAFWIEWKTFLRYFSQITISAYISDAHEIRIPARYTQSSTEMIPAFYFDLPQTTFLHISLVYHHHDRKEYANISQAFILKDVATESTNHRSIFRSDRSSFTHWSGSLQPGIYSLIPFSISFWHQRSLLTNMQNTFTIVVHSSVEIEGVLSDEASTYLADSLMSAVIEEEKKSGGEEFEQTFIYSTNKEQKLRVIVAENRSKTHFLNVTVDTNGSKNIHHSRNVFDTQDCLKPQTRQILGLIEWSNKPGESANLVYDYRRQKSINPGPVAPAFLSETTDLHSLRPIPPS